MNVAAWSYPIERLESFEQWHAKVRTIASVCASRDRQLLVVPEYASMELTALLAPEEQATLAGQLAGLQRMVADHDEVYRAASADRGIAIVSGSLPVRQPDGTYRNRLLVHAGGATRAVEKRQMTRFEREHWGISPGQGSPVIDLGHGARLGVAICYDAEFPLIVRELVLAGANVIAVPSCTDSTAGYYRVRVAAQARALENQCYVIHAPTVGLAPWSIAVDENVGASAVYGPPDRGFPEDGVVAMGRMNAPELVFAELDLALVDEVRRDGQVLNHRDWR